jgi:hypothetical protein
MSKRPSAIIHSFRQALHPRSGPHYSTQPYIELGLCTLTLSIRTLTRLSHIKHNIGPRQKVDQTLILSTHVQSHTVSHQTMGTKRSRQSSVSSSDSSQPSSYSRIGSSSAISSHHAVMRCSLPPHEPLSFDSFDAYDVHYQQSHMNRCSECLNNFPDEHFLHLHIAENHDPINESKRDNGEKTVGTFT